MQEMTHAQRLDAQYQAGFTAAQQAYANRGEVYRASGFLAYARALLALDGNDNIATASDIIQATIAAQMTAPQHPHRGNFLWLTGDPDVVDYNAVLFVLKDMLPLAVDHASKLAPALVESMRDCVALALDELERMDLAPYYSGVHILSLYDLLVGAQWLENSQHHKAEHYAQLARSRWARWVAETVASGTVHEFVSPVYAGLALTCLGNISVQVDNAEISLQAELMMERMWITQAVRLHTPSGQLAGPHSRVYWGPMVSGQNPVKDILWRETGWPWLLEPGPYGGRDADTIAGDVVARETYHHVSEAITRWLAHQAAALPYETSEVSDAAEGATITTYMSPSFALGTTNQTYTIGTDCFYIDHEANHLIAHYDKSDDSWGMMYSRYVVNDRHRGRLGAAPDRPKNNCFYDQGHFAAAQKGDKAIALYALKRQEELVHSLKTVVAYQSGAALDQVWLDGAPVSWDDLPLAVEPGQWLVVADGAALMGVRPLEQSCLGLSAPIVLEQGPEGELWLTIYNYKIDVSAAKRFWDYASLGGAFWQGNLKAGFVTEIAERDAWPDAAAFLAHLQATEISDETDANHLRTVRYASGDDTVELTYDLWNTSPVGQRIDGQQAPKPALDSPLAVQGDSGELAVGLAQLSASPQMMVLVAQEIDPVLHQWVVINPIDSPTPIHLSTPLGIVSCESMGLGRIELRAHESGVAKLIVHCARPIEGLTVPVGVTIRSR